MFLKRFSWITTRLAPTEWVPRPPGRQSGGSASGKVSETRGRGSRGRRRVSGSGRPRRRRCHHVGPARPRPAACRARASRGRSPPRSWGAILIGFDPDHGPRGATRSLWRFACCWGSFAAAVVDIGRARRSRACSTTRTDDRRRREAGDRAAGGRAGCRARPAEDGAGRARGRRAEGRRARRRACRGDPGRVAHPSSWSRCVTRCRSIVVLCTTRLPARSLPPAGEIRASVPDQRRRLGGASR